MSPSTTMKMLTGLLPATEGQALLLGRALDPNDMETRRRVGYMSQSFSLYSELTVRQNLDLHARLFQLPSAEARLDWLRRLLLRETFPLELELHRLDCLGSHGQLDIYDFLVHESRELAKKPEVRPPLLSGNDLLKLGLKPGPAIGEVLAEAREKQLQDELQTPAQARAWARKRVKM